MKLPSLPPPEDTTTSSVCLPFPFAFRFRFFVDSVSGDDSSDEMMMGCGLGLNTCGFDAGGCVGRGRVEDVVMCEEAVAEVVGREGPGREWRARGGGGTQSSGGWDKRGGKGAIERG